MDFGRISFGLSLPLFDFSFLGMLWVLNSPRYEPERARLVVRRIEGFRRRGCGC